MPNVWFHVHLSLTKRRIQKRAQIISQQLQTSPFDAHLYLEKAVNLALQAKMLVGTGPSKQPRPQDFNELARALAEVVMQNDRLYEEVGSLLAHVAEAAFTALELGRSRLVDPPVEDHWRDWKRTTIDRCREVVLVPYTSTEGYYRALRWLTGTLSQNPLDADLCLWTARIMAHTSHDEEAVWFFLLVWSLHTYRFFTGIQKSDFDWSIDVAEKVQQKGGRNQAGAYLLRGVIYLLGKDFQTAETEIKRARELDANATSSFCWISSLYRAWALDSLGRVDEANALRAATRELFY